ncbi:hypothetical protein H4219_000364 [Mycoemilia scoparia]|uniref:Uncharacterized protein n=1 Tax=Mycoemilia scoparia TaxID=417184 RepID=A0A9W8A3E4_9FUNG|nr:hypothetical protein H4219_000364 [Mycoemilia scoparia]
MCPGRNDTGPAPKNNKDAFGAYPNAAGSGYASNNESIGSPHRQDTYENPRKSTSFHMTELPRDILVPLSSRAEECQELLKLHPDFGQQVAHVLDKDSHNKFNSLIQKSRTEMCDSEWIKKLCLLLKGCSPLLWVQFKNLVGIDADDDPYYKHTPNKPADKNSGCSMAESTDAASNASPISEASHKFYKGRSPYLQTISNSGKKEKKYDTASPLDDWGFGRDKSITVNPEVEVKRDSIAQNEAVREAFVNAQIKQLLCIRTHTAIMRQFPQAAHQILNEAKQIFLKNPSAARGRASIDCGSVLRAAGDLGGSSVSRRLSTDNRWAIHAYDMWLQTLLTSKESTGISDDEWVDAVIVPLLPYPRILQTMCNVVDEIVNCLGIQSTNQTKVCPSRSILDSPLLLSSKAKSRAHVAVDDDIYQADNGSGGIHGYIRPHTPTIGSRSTTPAFATRIPMLKNQRRFSMLETPFDSDSEFAPSPDFMDLESIRRRSVSFGAEQFNN